MISVLDNSDIFDTDIGYSWAKHWHSVCKYTYQKISQSLRPKLMFCLKKGYYDMIMNKIQI